MAAARTVSFDGLVMNLFLVTKQLRVDGLGGAL